MDFKFYEDAPKMVLVSEVTSKDHNDIHYLYKLRKALVLLVGNENLSGFTEEQLKGFHSGIVGAMIANKGYHYWDDWCDDLDESLPQDLKNASDGYYQENKGSIFDLEEKFRSTMKSLTELSERIKEKKKDKEDKEKTPDDETDDKKINKDKNLMGGRLVKV